MAVLAFAYRNLDHYRRRFFLVLAASLVNGAVTLVVPLLLTEFTAKGFTFAKFERLIAVLIALVIAMLSAERVIRKHGEALAQQFGNHLRHKYFGLLEEQPLPRLSATHSGYAIALVASLAAKAQALMLDAFWSFPVMVTSLGFFLYFSVRTAWWLAALDLAVLAFFLVISTLLARRMSVLATGLNERSATFLQYFTDFLGNVATVKRLGVREFAVGRLGEKEAAANRQVQRVQDFHANRWAVLHAIFYVVSYSTIGLLLYEISQGRLSASVLIVFIAILNAMRYSIERLSENILSFTEAKVYVRDLEALVAPQAASGSRPRENPGEWEHITMADITFSYEGSAHVIAIPELTVRRGENVCVYGKSGQGKTTALALLAGFLQPGSGQRAVGGVAYDDIGPAWFRDHVAYISQDVELFSLPVWDNLVLGQDVSEATVRELLTRLDMAPWLGSLQDGLQTLVGERGARLSAGLRQRVNLARGILLGKDVYLLDEPTSHLDGETEQHAVAALEHYLRDKTVIIVTHRDAVRRICDREYEMRDHVLRELPAS